MNTYQRAHQSENIDYFSDPLEREMDYGRHEVMKTSSNNNQGASSVARAPLRPRQINIDSQGPSLRNSKPSLVKPSSSSLSSSSSSSRKKSSEEETSENSVEIEEIRRKPNGDGHTVHRYLRGKMLGKGGFAKVYLCTSLDTNRSYAVKIVPKANLVKTRARQKVRTNRSLKEIL